MLVDNGANVGAWTPLTTPEAFSLVIARGSQVSALTPMTNSALLVQSNAVLSCPAGSSNLSVTVLGDFGIETGGKLDVNGLGYGTGTGPGAGLVGGGGWGSGAGHGGVGGHSYNAGYIPAPGGGAYDSIVTPTQWGSGGGSTGGGTGGGAVFLNVGGSLRVDGTITADGLAPSDCCLQHGAGAGGSLWINTGTLTGGGLIAARGGPGGVTQGGGAGGGGRIALHVTQNTHSGVIAATGGRGFQNGGAGTIYTKLEANACALVLVDNGTNAGLTRLNSSQWPPGMVFDLTISGYAIVNPDAPQTFRNLVMTNNAVVTHDPSQSGFHWTCLGNASIASNAAFDVDGMGYGAGGGTGHGSVGGGGWCSGAGHGGYGAHSYDQGYTPAPGGFTYGSSNAPITLGSGGGGNGGGSGGGAIQITVMGALQFDGWMTANGLMGGANQGSGAGGSLWISADTLSGAGTLRAQGGSAPSNHGAAGGGGRIAIDSRDRAGYSGTESVSGANAGTIVYGLPPIPPPVITSPLTATGQVRVAFSYQITALNSPTSFGAANLPAGLQVNTTSGLISGVPLASGAFGVTLFATNTSGATSGGLALQLQPAVPFVTSTVLQPSGGANDGTDDGSAGKGKDRSSYGDNGSSTILFLFNSPCNLGLQPAYLQFAVASQPTQQITRAEISVYCKMFFNGAGWPWPAQSYTISLRRVTAPWNELTVPASVAPTPLASRSVTAVGGGSPGFVEFEGWLTFDITSLYRDWASGTATNYGVQLAIDTTYCANGDLFFVYSSDYETASLRPKLSVEAGIQPTLTITADAGNAVLNWNTVSNAIYQVESSASLTNWSTLGLPFLGRGGPTNVSAPMSPPARFFRVGVQ